MILVQLNGRRERRGGSRRCSGCRGQRSRAVSGGNITEIEKDYEKLEKERERSKERGKEKKTKRNRQRNIKKRYREGTTQKKARETENLHGGA